MRILPQSIFGRTCPCGAVIENGAKQCRKCRSRARWNRRKFRHDYEGVQ